jgi:Asp/Glu/hydantoin racemase
MRVCDNKSASVGIIQRPVIGIVTTPPVQADGNGVRFWIITETKRQISTVLMPEDY